MGENDSPAAAGGTSDRPPARVGAVNPEAVDVFEMRLISVR